MLRTYVTRESIFGAALLGWLCGGCFLAAYLMLARTDPEMRIGVAALGCALGGAILYYLLMRLEFMQAVRDSMCEFGTGKANATQLVYFLFLPLMIVWSVFSLAQAAQEQQRVHAELGRQQADERPGKIVVLCSQLGISAEEASALLDEYGGDEERALRERLPLAPGACPQCRRPMPAGKPCSYCGVGKIECPSCHCKIPGNLAKCQYCHAALR